MVVSLESSPRPFHLFTLRRQPTKATYPPKMEESSVAAKSAENSGKDDRTNERKDAEMGDREGGGRALSAQPLKRSRAPLRKRGRAHKTK